MMKAKEKYNFKVFDVASKCYGEFPRVTINKAGNINFNKKFKDAYGAKTKGRHLVFHYDQKNLVIGLQIVTQPTTISNPIRELEKGKGLSVSARAFLKHNKIPYSESRSFGIELYEEIDSLPFFIIDLKKMDQINKEGQ